MNKKKKAVNHSCYPDEVIERLARCFYPAILESFNKIRYNNFRKIKKEDMACRSLVE